METNVIVDTACDVLCTYIYAENYFGFEIEIIIYNLL